MQDVELGFVRKEATRMSVELEELRNLIDQRDSEVLRLKVRLQELSIPSDKSVSINGRMMDDLNRSASEIEHLRKCIIESVPKSEYSKLQEELHRSAQKIARQQNLILRMQGLIDQLIERIETLVQSVSSTGRGDLMQVEIEMCNAQISRLQFCIDTISQQQARTLTHTSSVAYGKGGDAAAPSATLGAQGSKLSIV